MYFFFKKSCLVFMLFGLFACATLPITGADYSYEDARTPVEVFFGEVIAVRDVTISGKNSGLGALSGAFIGSQAGEKVGKGSGAEVGQLLGGIAGLAIGDRIEASVGKKQGIEIIVRLESGKTNAYVQEKTKKEVFKKGDPVQVTLLRGVYRVSPQEL